MKYIGHKKNLSGSVSVYLSLSLTLIISLIFYTIESCHIDSLVAHSNGVTYMALESLFGQYCLPLFEKYGLFCLNEQGIDLENELSKYTSLNSAMPKSLIHDNGSFLNMSVDNIAIKNIKYITDDDGEVFIKQICDYTKYLEISNLANELISNTKTEYPKMFEADEFGVIDISFDNIDTSKLSSYYTEKNDTSSVSDDELKALDPDTFEESVSTSLRHIIKNGILSFLVKDPSTVSSKSIDKVTLPSVTCQLSDEGINASYGYYEDVSETTYNKACFCEYIIHTFNSFVNPCKTSPLSYSMEYIIYGSPNDDTNFINCCLQLISLRTGLNLVYLLSETDKCEAAMRLVELTSPIPLLKYVMFFTIMTLWASAEAIIDVRDLIANKKVPLIKSDKSWTLSLSGLKNFSKSTVSTNKGTEGLSYERYLEMLIATQNNISIYYRTMDLIQMDICANYNKDFRLSKCVYSLDTDITYGFPFIFLPGKTRYTCEGNYHYK